MAGSSPIYGDAYARTYDGPSKTYFNAAGEPIPDEFAGKPEEEGRRMHDLWKKDEKISEGQKTQIEQEEAGRRLAQEQNERKATIKRRVDEMTGSLSAAGVGTAEINRQAELIRNELDIEPGDEAPDSNGEVTSGTDDLDIKTDDETSDPNGEVTSDTDDLDDESEKKSTPSDRPRPDDLLGAAAWDVDHASTIDEKREVLSVIHHQTLSNLCMSLDIPPVHGPGSKAKNVAAVLAKIDKGD